MKKIKLWSTIISLVVIIFGIAYTYTAVESGEKQKKDTPKEEVIEVTPSDYSLSYSDLWMSFPPVRDIEQRTFSKKHLDTLWVEKIRFGEDWTFREEVKWEYKWKPLDERIQWLKDNNYELLLTVQSKGPDWACSELVNEKWCVFKDNSDFKRYTDTLAQRYSNMIEKIQFWNEWQIKWWYPGEAEEFVESHNALYESFKKYSPNTDVVLWGFTTTSLRFLAWCNNKIDSFHAEEGELLEKKDIYNLCKSEEVKESLNRIDYVMNNAKFDIVDLHLYDDSENWKIYVENIKAQYNIKDIIVSEFWGPNMNIVDYSDELQSKEFIKYIEVLDAMRIPEIYYYSLVEWNGNPIHKKSGVITESLKTKSSYWVFKAINK